MSAGPDPATRPADPQLHHGRQSEAEDDDPASDDLREGDADARVDENSDLPAVEAMRRFWDSEIADGRIPTGAGLSRAAGVSPRTGLGRRKRREWVAELSDHLTTAAASGR